MKHARSDYACVQPWLTKRDHIARQNGKVVDCNTTDSWGETDLAVQIKHGRIGPIIPEDEPVFLIRGQDLAAIPAAEAWCEAAAALGTDSEAIDAVRCHIELVREWQVEHGKVPDAPSEYLR